MAKFWIFVLLAFVGLLFTVNYVSRRSSQAQIDEAARIAPVVRVAPNTQAGFSPAPDPRMSSQSAAPAAGALYKCVDAAGHQSFQSQPCAAGSTQAWVRDATPEHEPRRAERQRRALPGAEGNGAVASHRPTYSPGAASPSADPASSTACRIAREADAAYRRQPLRYVTHDGLRRHGDQVNAACY